MNKQSTETKKEIQNKRVQPLTKFIFL